MTRLFERRPGIRRASGAFLVLAGCLIALPAYSNDLTTSPIDEPRAPADAELEIDTPILEPRARQAVREAFRDDLLTPAADKEDATIEETPPSVMNTQLPGVSPENLDRYKRRMYRRDI